MSLDVSLHYVSDIGPLGLAEGYRQSGRSHSGVDCSDQGEGYEDQVLGQCNFFLVVAETPRGWDETAVAVIKRLAGKVAAQPGRDPDETTRYLFQRFGVLLQKGNAALPEPEPGGWGGRLH